MWIQTYVDWPTVFRPSLPFRSSVLQKGVGRLDVNQLYRQSSFPRYTPQPRLAALVASWLIFLVARAISRKILTFGLVWCLLSRGFPSGCRHPSIWFFFFFLGLVVFSTHRLCKRGVTRILGVGYSLHLVYSFCHVYPTTPRSVS